MTLSSADLSSQILFPRSLVVSAVVLLLTHIFGGGDKKKSRTNLCALTVTSQMLRKAQGSSQHLFPWENAGLSSQQNLFHAGDSYQTLFITSLPPASTHTALYINSCFAFTELHPPSLSFFSEHFSNLFDLLKWKRLHWAASTNT